MHPVTTPLPVFDVQLLEPEPTPAPAPEPAPAAAHPHRAAWWVAGALALYLLQVTTIIVWAVYQ